MRNRRRQPTAHTRDVGSGTVSRRAFVHGVVIASLASGLPRLSVLALSPDATRPAATPAPPDAVLCAVLNRLIPADGVMPAAGNVGVGAFVERVSQANGRVRRQMARVVGACRRSSGVPRSDGAIDRALRRLERDRPADFDLFIQAVYAGYYTHPRVLAALQPHPDRLSV